MAFADVRVNLPLMFELNKAQLSKDEREFLDTNGAVWGERQVPIHSGQIAFFQHAFDHACKWHFSPKVAQYIYKAGRSVSKKQRRDWYIFALHRAAVGGRQDIVRFIFGYNDVDPDDTAFLPDILLDSATLAAHNNQALNPHLGVFWQLLLHHPDLNTLFGDVELLGHVTVWDLLKGIIVDDSNQKSKSNIWALRYMLRQYEERHKAIVASIGDQFPAGIVSMILPPLPRDFNILHALESG